MNKFRKKPVVVEAVKLTKDNVADIVDLIAGPWRVWRGDYGLTIETLEGDMTAMWGDYIIQGVHGEFYPCKPDIFDETYEPVEVDRD